MEDQTVTISVDEYMKLKKSYDEYQSKEYKIRLRVTKVVCVEEDGSRKDISVLNTDEVFFPDGTESQLSELFNEVNQNSDYLKHIEGQMKNLKVENNSLTVNNKELEEEIENIRRYRDKPTFKEYIAGLFR